MSTIIERGGRYQVKIRVRGYPIRSRTFDSKKDAAAFAKVTESEMIRGVFVDTSTAEKTTFKEALKQYLSEVTPTKKGAFQEGYKIRRWMKNDLACRSMASLKPIDFAVYRDKRLKQVSPGTVVKELAVVSHLFSIAQKEWGLAVVNPIKLIRKPQVKDSRDRRLEGDDETKLMAELDKCANKYLRPVAEFAIETGMRQGEILGLGWRDVDDKYVRLSDTKNGDSRDVPLSVKARKILADLPTAKRKQGRVFIATKQGLEQA